MLTHQASHVHSHLADNSYQDYDKVAVLQASKLVEFGSPSQLLRDGHDGPFSKLIDRTGPSLSMHLRAVARGAAEFSAEALAEMKEDDSTPKAGEQP